LLFYPEVVDVVAVAVATPGMLQTPHSSSSETGSMYSHLQPPFSHARIVVSQSWNSDSFLQGTEHNTGNTEQGLSCREHRTVNLNRDIKGA
jgi:hypothetical protein